MSTLIVTPLAGRTILWLRTSAITRKQLFLTTTTRYKLGYFCGMFSSDATVTVAVKAG